MTVFTLISKYSKLKKKEERGVIVKKITSLLCILILAATSVPFAMASNVLYGTVVYHGEGFEAFNVTMPQYLFNDDSGEISIEGSGPSNRRALISIDKKYENDVMFPGILVVGNNTTKSNGKGILTTDEFHKDDVFNYLELNIEFNDV